MEALAVSLQKKGFDVIVLESDASFDSRAQGYGLTVQATDAMQAMGVDISLEMTRRPPRIIRFRTKAKSLDSLARRLVSRAKIVKKMQNSGRFIHIPRQVLRQRILEAVRPDTIRWSSKLKKF